MKRVQVKLKDTSEVRAAFPKEMGLWFTVQGFSKFGFVRMSRQLTPRCSGSWSPHLFNWNNVRLEPRKKK